MDTDDLEPRPPKSLKLGQEDLSPLSLEELKTRIVELQEEIERCEVVITSKQGSQAAAEDVFKV
jgi:uncharacterized small protein (DUF1192 family)